MKMLKGVDVLPTAVALRLLLIAQQQPLTALVNTASFLGVKRWHICGTGSSNVSDRSNRHSATNNSLRL